MKLDKTLQILDLEDKPVIERAGDPPITFGKLVSIGLLADSMLPGHPPTSGADKVKWFQLAIRVEKAEQYFELSIEEAALVKRKLEVFPPLYVGRCFAIMEAAANPPT